jgi:Tol biopolymer transport system component
MIGQSVGPYQVLSKLGEGGMGEVYRARDLKLNREVAMKVLPEAFTRNPDRLSRFKREAQVLASLNHPNIAAIYGFEESSASADSRQSAVQALVLELVEGPTLADRIAQRPVPELEALRIAKQIAEALEAAHEQGIVHRDLKPANIKVRPDDTVKVLDFGLAKIAAADSGPDLSLSPTMTSGATRDGVILGTAAYMSPEQARGKPLDKRTDIWSFGCVLYEMLTGRSAFAGETVSDTIVAVLEREPDWSLLPDATLPAVRWLLQRCLEKDRRRRLHDVADVRIEIEDTLTPSASGSLARPALASSAAGSASAGARRRERLWAAAAAALAIAVVVLAALAMGRRAAPPRLLRLSVVPPVGTTFTPKDFSGMPLFAMSPDGNRLAFVASAPGGPPLLWVQQLDSGAAQPLAGTDGATTPFWAPDSQRLAFFARGRLKKVSLGGAAPQDLAEAGAYSSGAWNASEIIVFASTGPLVRVSSEGGPVEPVTNVDVSRGEFVHGWPQFLPDGRRFIFHVASVTAGNRGTYVGSLDSVEKTQILSSNVNAVYAPSGHLLFDRAGTLMVQPFDTKVGKLTGQASAFGDRVMAGPGPSYLALSIGADGTMAYWDGPPATTELMWFDRDGRPLGRIRPPGQYMSLALSPRDSALLITDHVTPARNELSKIELTSGVSTRLTFPAGEFSFGRFGTWSPDGKNVVYVSIEADGTHTYQIDANGSDQRPFPLTPPALFPEEWSREWFVYETILGRTLVDIWALDLADRKSRPIVEEPYNQLQARLSPDGRWLAYASDDSGSWEVYVRPFPDARGTKWLVSTSTKGGSQPVWRSNGKELFYVAADNRLVAVPIVGTGTVAFGVSQPLFDTRLPPVIAPWRTNYAVSSDGQKFLLNSVLPDAAPAPITIAVNQQEKWKK